MYVRRDFNTIGGVRIYPPPSQHFGNSGHVTLYPESLYDLKLTQSSRVATVVGEATVEGFQYLVGTTHYDDEDGQLYVTTKVFVGSSPVDPVVMAERAPVLANGLVSIKHSKIPGHIGDIFTMTGRAQDSVQAANEWRSDADSIFPDTKLQAGDEAA